jgi:hypothetical protein
MSFSLIKKNLVEPEIKCNRVLTGLNSIKQYSSVPHGQSLLALFLVDPNNKNVQISIAYSYETVLNDLVEQLFGVWQKYEPIKSMIRSFKKDGVYLDELDGLVLQKTNSTPTSETDYDNKQVIIDVEMFVDGTYEIKLHKYSEQNPRILKLLYKV